MNCTEKEQETCGVEKMGCTGCAYNNESIISELISIEKRLNEISKEHNLKLDIDTIELNNLQHGNYTRVVINAYKELR